MHLRCLTCRPWQQLAAHQRVCRQNPPSTASGLRVEKQRRKRPTLCNFLFHQMADRVSAFDIRRYIQVAWWAKVTQLLLVQLNARAACEKPPRLVACLPLSIRRLAGQPVQAKARLPDNFFEKREFHQDVCVP